MRPITRAERRNILERFREQYGDNRISTLEQRHIVKLLSRLKPAASRNWLKALRALLDFAVAEGFRPDNPAAFIKFRKYNAKSHHAWTAEEIERFEAYWPIGSKPRLGLALLLHTAQRRGDVVLMGARHTGRASLASGFGVSAMLRDCPSPLCTARPQTCRRHFARYTKTADQARMVQGSCRTDCEQEVTNKPRR